MAFTIMGTNIGCEEVDVYMEKRGRLTILYIVRDRPQKMLVVYDEGGYDKPSFFVGNKSVPEAAEKLTAASPADKIAWAQCLAMAANTPMRCSGSRMIRGSEDPRWCFEEIELQAPSSTEVKRAKSEDLVQPESAESRTKRARSASPDEPQAKRAKLFPADLVAAFVDAVAKSKTPVATGKLLAQSDDLRKAVLKHFPGCLAPQTELNKNGGLVEYLVKEGKIVDTAKETKGRKWGIPTH
jgi:hypothetical protein